MTRVLIRELDEKDWVLYKTIRLKSLIDSPDSFSATYANEFSIPDQEWQKKLNSGGRSAFKCPLIAFSDAAPSGIAWGVIHNEGDKHANLYQMWVDPEQRGHGIGKALLQRVISWSIDKKRSCINLGVTTTNSAAIRLYKSAGFRECGDNTPLRHGSELSEQGMTLDLPAVAVH